MRLLSRWLLRVCSTVTCIALLAGCSSAIVIQNQRSEVLRVIKPFANKHHFGEMHINGKNIAVQIPSEYHVEVTALELFLAEKRAPNEGVLWGARLTEKLEFAPQRTPYCLNSGSSPRAFSVAYFNINDGLIHSILDFPAGDAIERCVSLFSGVEEPTIVTGQFLMMPYGWFDAVGIKKGHRFDRTESGFAIKPIYRVSGRIQNILDEWDNDPASQLAATRARQAPVIATWNGQPITHVEVTGREIGTTQDRRYSLIVTAILDVNEPDSSIKNEKQIKAVHEQRVEHFLPLFRDKYRALKPWEGILLGSFEQRTCASGSCDLGARPATLAFLKPNGTISHLMDTDSRGKIDWSSVPSEHYLLITWPGWFDAYHIKVGDTLPIARAATEQALPPLLAQAAANQPRTEAALAQAKLKKEQEANFLAMARDFNRLREYYDIDVKLSYHNARIGGSYDDPSPGFLDMLNRLFGGTDRTVNARAWQCSDRSYTVTFHSKGDIEYVDVVNNPNPVVVDATWSLSHVVSGDTSAAGSISRTLNLPVRRAGQVSETFSFDCINDMHTEQGEETASELRMALADQSSFRVHHTTATNSVNRDAVYAESGRQWNRLNQIIDEHNARVAASRSSSSYDSGSSSSYNGPSQEKCQGIVDQMKGERVVRSSTRNGLTTGTDSPKYTREQIEAALKREGCM